MSIRTKMTLWYGGVLATVLVVFGVAVYVMMRHQLSTRLDAGLRQELAEVMDEAQEVGSNARLKERLEKRFTRREDYDFQISGADGEVIFRSERFKELIVPTPAIPSSFKHLDFETVPLGARTENLGGLGRFRVASELVPGPSSTVVIQAATSLKPDDHELSELLFVLLLAGPLALGCALGGGYLLARKALAPVDRMASTAGEITANDLHRRLDVPNPNDELGRLATTLNAMIARLERSFEEMRRFTADAAHELRTPLTVLRAEAEVALRNPREPEQYREVLDTMLEEVERLTRLAEQLLFLSRKDAGLVPRIRKPLLLDRVAEDVSELMRVVAEQKGLSLTFVRSVPCQILGDADQLRQVLFNLIDNAIKFTPAGGKVTVRCEAVADAFQVVIADTGIGISVEHLPHLFERFYRVDPARSQEAGGTGLGLSIGKAITEAHGGSLLIESTVGVETVASLRLPVAPASATTRTQDTKQDETTNQETQPDFGECQEKEKFKQCSR